MGHGQAFTFVAKSTQTTLTFTSTTGSGWGPAIDNVGITQTLATGADCKNNGWKAMVDKNGRLSRTRATASATTRPARRTSPSSNR